MTLTEEELDLQVMREMLCDALRLPRETPVKELTVQATCALFRASAADERRNTQQLIGVV